MERFQQRHGLNPDGVIGPTTLEALNVPVTTRISQLRVALERGRLLLQELPERFVLVNIPAFRVLLVDEGRARLVLARGGRQAVHPDAQLPRRDDVRDAQSSRDHPARIVKSDVIPGLRKRSQLSSRRRGTRRSAPGTFSRRGRTMRWGTVKAFMFLNPHHVYLHDTPNRELFASDARTFSHGCIRVEKVVDLATMVIDDSVNWSRARIDSVIAAGRTRNITLRRRLRCCSSTDGGDRSR